MAVKLLTEDGQKDANAWQSKSLFSFSRKEIEELFKKAKYKATGPGLRLIQTEGLGKILVVTPRKCGSAVKRNRFKRQVKAIFYEEKLYERPATSALIVKKEAMDLSFDELKKFLKKNI